LRPAALNRFAQVLIVTLICGVILMKTPIFKEGLNVLSTRFNEVAESSEKSMSAGLIERAFSDFGEGLFLLTKAPFLGYGLGVGTNAGGKFLTGNSMFLLTEGEWSRVFLESGPVLGLAYVLWRVGLVLYVGLLCMQSVRLGNVLPLLLFSSSSLTLLSGQFGQPTILGFSVFVTGLALAARSQDWASVEESDPPATPAAVPLHRPMRRSAYASRLHGPAGRPEHTNGSVDR